MAESGQLPSPQRPPGDGADGGNDIIDLQISNDGSAFEQMLEEMANHSDVLPTRDNDNDAVLVAPNHERNFPVAKTLFTSNEPRIMKVYSLCIHSFVLVCLSWCVIV